MIQGHREMRVFPIELLLQGYIQYRGRQHQARSMNLNVRRPSSAINAPTSNDWAGLRVLFSLAMLKDKVQRDRH